MKLLDNFKPSGGGIQSLSLWAPPHMERSIIETGVHWFWGFSGKTYLTFHHSELLKTTWIGGIPSGLPGFVIHARLILKKLGLSRAIVETGVGHKPTSEDEWRKNNWMRIGRDFSEVFCFKKKPEAVFLVTETEAFWTKRFGII